MTDEDVLKTFNDLEMMRRPHLWPSNVLHLKQREAERHSYRNFALLSYQKDEWTFTPKYKADAFSEPNFAQSQTGDEALLLRLAQEGWIVD